MWCVPKNKKKGIAPWIQNNAKFEIKVVMRLFLAAMIRDGTQDKGWNTKPTSPRKTHAETKPKTEAMYKDMA